MTELAAVPDTDLPARFLSRDQYLKSLAHFDAA